MGASASQSPAFWRDQVAQVGIKFGFFQTKQKIPSDVGLFYISYA
jgi:hypothetical protein